MKLSDKLKQTKQTHIEAMQRLLKAAETEGREFTDAERGAFDTAEKAAKTLQGDIERALTAEGTALAERPASPAVVITDKGVKVPILKAADKLGAHFMDRAEYRDLIAEGGGEGGMGATIKGIVTGNWDGRHTLQKALSEGTLSGGGYAVPAPLAAQWLDMLRAKSVVIAAGAGTIPMDSQTLRIAALATDPVVTSRKENTAINASDPTFRAVDLKAKSHGVLVTSSVELLADSPNAAAMVEAALLGSMAAAMDAACLTGNGSTAGNLDNVLGILNFAGIGDIPYVADSYDAFIDALADIWADNIEPTSVIMGPTSAATLAKLKTGLGEGSDKTTLVPPPEYAALAKFRTTSMPADVALVSDMARAIIGMRQGIEIEATRQGGSAFANAQVLIRALMRFDIQPLFAGKGFAKVATADEA